MTSVADQTKINQPTTGLSITKSLNNPYFLLTSSAIKLMQEVTNKSNFIADNN